MAIADLEQWISQYASGGAIWLAKRLAANDTLANQSHQAGPYIPKEFMFWVCPSLEQPAAENPDVRLTLFLDSHGQTCTARAVWYNNKISADGTRNETRITGLGGRTSALLDPDNTGALAVFVFVPRENGALPDCHVWVCTQSAEEDSFEERLGPVEPKSFIVWEPAALAQPTLFGANHQRRTCHLRSDEIPDAWRVRVPTGEEIIRRTLEVQRLSGMKIDARLMRRRKCEYEIFQSIEQAIFLPRVQHGFRTIDEFVKVAQSILQSRKSRSGNSLELHARQILQEEGLKRGTDFVCRPVIEGGKIPDFLFPSESAYNDPAFPAENLRMLAAKTICKDRWRQVIEEADRIRTKHLLTLQEGVSVGQFRQMREAGIQLVVPIMLHRAYPDSVRPHLLSLDGFIEHIRQLNPRHTV